MNGEFLLTALLTTCEFRRTTSNSGALRQIYNMRCKVPRNQAEFCNIFVSARRFRALSQFRAEKLVGFTKYRSMWLTSGPRASDSAFTFCHSGSACEKHPNSSPLLDGSDAVECKQTDSESPARLRAPNNRCSAYCAA